MLSVWSLEFNVCADCKFQARDLTKYILGRPQSDNTWFVLSHHVCFSWNGSAQEKKQFIKKQNSKVFTNPMLMNIEESKNPNLWFTFTKRIHVVKKRINLVGKLNKTTCPYLRIYDVATICHFIKIRIYFNGNIDSRVEKWFARTQRNKSILVLTV